MEFFDDQLDLVAVQDSLVLLWEDALGSLPLDLPTPGTPEALELATRVVDTVATRLAEYPAYRGLYTTLVERLLFAGEYVGPEDLIDLLTLKDTPETQLEDFGTALKVLFRTSDLPESRRNAALKSIYRRAVVRDDWFALSETTNVADEVIEDDLRSTGLFALLSEVLAGDEEEGGREAWMEMNELVGEDGAREVLEARFGAGQVERLQEDERRERETVRVFLEDSDLPRLAGAVAGLAAREGEGMVVE